MATSDDILANISTTVTWTAKALRFLKQRGFLVRARNTISLAPLSLFHDQFIHSFRRMERELLGKDHRQQAITGLQVCNCCAAIMRNVLELPKNQLSCSIKLLTGPLDQEERVMTWIRSEPTDSRDETWPGGEESTSESRPLSSHTAWSAIYGRGIWDRRYPCFCCNDLASCAGKFVCERPNWQKYYRSMLVFPMQYAKDELGRKFANTGFLCFDSPRKDAFVGMPNIFDHPEPSRYRDNLEACMHFHLGAVFADLLGSAFRIWDDRQPAAPSPKT